MNTLLRCIPTCVLVVVGCQAEPAPPPLRHVQRGILAANLEIWPEQFARPRVMIFVRTDCPIANRYAPEIKRLHDQFRETAQFVLVYCSERETASQIDTHASEFYSQQIPVLRDPRHTLVTLCEVTTTPEVVVYNRAKELLYRGRIDDRYVDFGVERPEPTQQDLRDILTAIDTGARITFRETPVVGCPIARVNEPAAR